MRIFALLILLVAFFRASAQTIDSLDIKIGQMIMVGLTDFYDLEDRKLLLKAVSDGTVGGIILFEKDLMPVNTRQELAKMIAQIQKDAPIPLFMGIDEEGGKVNRLKPKYGFPKTVSAAYLGGIDAIDSTVYYARATASNLQQFGFNINYAPTVDLNVNPNNPVIGKVERSYSADPQKVARHAAAVVTTHASYNIATVLKHFPGHGSSTRDTHLGLTDVSTTWQFEELYPYKKLLDSIEIPAIMTAHIINRTLDEKLLPATLSNKVVTGMLRNHLGFEGVIFSDDMHMGAISKNYGFEESIVLCVQAGVDVLMFSNNIFDDQLTTANRLHEIIKQNVLNGKIEIQSIEASYQRIILLKKKLGLLEQDYTVNLVKQLRQIK